jgi:WD40 repeat protein
VDTAGNSYVAGTAQGGLTFVVRKYDPLGHVLWTDTGRGAAAAVVLDAKSGRVYVTGTDGADVMTRAYDPSGTLLWKALYAGPGAWTDEATALALDPSGNIVVTGWSSNTCSGGFGTCWDFVTVQYSSGGAELWVATYQGPLYGDTPSAIGTDAAGNVFVTGRMMGQSGLWATNTDYLTLKYSASGVLQWAARYNGTGDYDDIPYALAVDAAGNVFVTGSSDGTASNTDLVTVKYGPDGTEEWVSRLDSGGYDEGTAIVADASGCVYVTGNAGRRTRTTPP